MAAASTNRNWFAIWVSIAVVVVLVVLGGLVVFLNNQATAPGAAPKSDIIDEETGAITFGKGKEEVNTFVDFICPACNAFEGQFGQKLQEAAADDKITLNIHPVGVLDHYSTTEYSSRAAGAMYCVAEKAPEVALDYFNVLFEKQPAEGGPGLPDSELSSLAEQVGAGAAADCIADGTYKKFTIDQAKSNDIRATPTIEVNDKRIENAQIGVELAKILG